MNTFREIDITRVEAGRAAQTLDSVVCEHTLTIRLGGRTLVNLLCSPDHLEDLAVGHLFSEGIISGAGDIESLTLSEDVSRADVTLAHCDESVFQAEKTAGTGLGRPYSITRTWRRESALAPLDDDVTFTLPGIFACLEDFRRMSELFKRTGGSHSCCLWDGTSILAYREDIGRHNAVDKALGRAVRESMDLTRLCLVSSGRSPSDMVIKAINSGVPVLVSNGAPTDAAIDMARAHNLTLAGFARQSRLNIYAGQNRLVMYEHDKKECIV